MEDRIVRARVADLEAYGDRTNISPNDCDVSVVGTTDVLEAYPTTANSVYYIKTAQIDADATEGSVAALTLDSGVLFAINLGTAIPPTGTAVIVSLLGGRWAFRYDG